MLPFGMLANGLLNWNYVYLFIGFKIYAIIFSQPHGPFAAFMHSHCNETILFSFVLAPVLCCPTFFVFKVQKRIVADSVVPLYHVDADKETKLYR